MFPLLRRIYWLIFSISMALPAYGIRLPLEFAEDNQSKGLTVVEVLGALKGTGIIIEFDGKPAILTNSHNLQGHTSAIVTLPKKDAVFIDEKSYELKRYPLGFKRELPVLMDFPRSDFTLLGLSSTSFTTREYELISLYAKANGSLSSTGSKTWTPGPKVNLRQNLLAAVLKGQPTVIPQIARLYSITVANKIIVIPAYSRPGISGGAYYAEGVLAGLMMKVSLSGKPETWAIPMQRIGQIISKKFSYADEGRWDRGRLIFTDGKYEVTLTSGDNAGETGNGGGETGNGGGETGNGGGETGNGGGETGNGGDLNSPYWSLKVSDFTGKHLITMWNPFQPRKNALLLNGEAVSYFEKQKKFFIPSQATFEEGFRTIYLRNSQSEQQLEEARKKKVQPEISWGRLFYLKNGVLENFSMQSGLYNEGTQALLPNRNGKWPQNKFVLPGPAAVISFEQGNLFPDGFYYNLPFSTKRSDGLLLHVRRPAIQATDKKTEILASADFQEIKILMENETIVLKRTKSFSAASMLFTNPTNDIKALYVFNSYDLASIERIIISFPDQMMEFWPCSAQPGCSP